MSFDATAIFKKIFTLMVVLMPCSPIPSLQAMVGSHIRVDADEVDINGDTPLHHACRSTNLWTADELEPLITPHNANLPNNHSRTPLHLACKAGNIDTALQLLSYEGEYSVQPSITMQDNKGNTPLHLLCKNDLASAESDHVDEIMPQLTVEGLKNMRNGQGKTPLHIICKNTTVVAAGVIEALITHENINAPDSNGDTPLHHACRSKNLWTADELAPLITPHNANLPNNHGRTPLHLACAAGNLDTALQLLDYENEYSVKPSITTQDNYGNTPLHLLCTAGCANADGPIEICSLFNQLIFPGVQNIQNKAKQYPLHCISGEESNCYADTDIIQTLITKKNIMAPDEDGNTPLHHACGANNLATVQALLTNSKARQSALNSKFENNHGKMPEHVLDPDHQHYGTILNLLAAMRELAPRTLIF
jgi:ankyrin repeat protein